jgi:hypothetical protein
MTSRAFFLLAMTMCHVLLSTMSFIYGYLDHIYVMYACFVANLIMIFLWFRDFLRELAGE